MGVLRFMVFLLAAGTVITVGAVMLMTFLKRGSNDSGTNSNRKRSANR